MAWHRGRTARGAVVAAVIAVVLVGCDVAPSVQSGDPVVAQPPLVPASPSASTTSSGPPRAPDPAPALTPLPGWADAGAVPALFAGATVTGAVAWRGSIVAVGCDQEATMAGSLSPVDAPIWVGTGADWQRSGPVSLAGPTGSEPAPVTCIDQVVASPHELFAVAGSAVIRSTDGLTWAPVELDADGWVDAILTIGDQVTVLTSRASLAESRIASLWTTTDGLTWARLGGAERAEAGVGDDPAVVFDNGGVADVIAVAGGLVAVGASPGGEFVPTAAAWTSADSVTWLRATVEDAEGCYLTAVAATSPGLLGAGWCTPSGQPALWTSADGTAWQRAAAPGVDLAPNSFVAVSALSVLDDGVIAVAGTVSVAGYGSATAAQWISGDGWQRADDIAAPYHVVGGTGFWPPTGSGVAAVLLAE